MASDRVVVNAGGRRFETTTTTLMSSGSGYFSALLGFTGAALGSLPRLENVEESTAVTLQENARKRARNDDNGANNNTVLENSGSPTITKEMFVDRDPDLFADVLHFMRSARLPASTRQNMARLDDLKAEAAFFGYDELETACEEQLKVLRDALDQALKPEPQPEAKCCSFIVEAGEVVEINVPKHQVLYISSATLAGRVYAMRYRPSDKSLEQRRKENEESGSVNTSAMVGCYLNPCEQTDTGDFQLAANIGDGQWLSIAHVALDHFHLYSEMALNVDLRQDIRQFLAPCNDSEGQTIVLASEGSGDWHLSCWIGEPSAIPQLSSNLERKCARSQNTLTTRGAVIASAAEAQQLMAIIQRP